MTESPVVVPYDDNWPDDYQTIFLQLLDVLGTRALRIEHIGSTAVPGLSAKDVIDVQVSVADLDGEVGALLAAQGFRRVAQVDRDHSPPGADDAPDDWRKLLFVEPQGTRRVNLHVRQVGRANERFAILFRDYLRAYPQAAQAYAEFKRRLSIVMPTVDDYADLKDPVADLILQAAELWAAAGGWRVDPTTHLPEAD